MLHVRGPLAHVLHRDAHLALGLERHLAREHLVEADPERVDVGLLRHLLAQRLLGRDVVGGAEHAASGGEAAVVERPGDSEVGDLRAPLEVHEHVLGLHVAVHEPLRVRRRQRARDLHCVRHRLHHRQAGAPPEPGLEGLALHVLEDDVGVAVVVSRVDDGDDVGVGEARHRPRLAAEALVLEGVVRERGVHELDRHPALQRLVERPVDGRHPPGADLLLEPEAAT